MDIKYEKTEFGWWRFYGWMNLLIAPLYLLLNLKLGLLGLFIVLLNTILMVLVLKYNKYAFLLSTISSLNPLLWIINGIYLKNRWNHPKLNNKNEIKDEKSKSTSIDRSRIKKVSKDDWLNTN